MNVAMEVEEIVIVLKAFNKKYKVEDCGDFTSITWDDYGIDVDVPVPVPVRTIAGQKMVPGFHAWVGVSTPGTREVQPYYDMSTVLETTSSHAALRALFIIEATNDIECKMMDCYNLEK